jgi:hypothetical protein
MVDSGNRSPRATVATRKTASTVQKGAPMSESATRLWRSLAIGGGITAGSTIAAMLSAAADIGPISRIVRALFIPGETLVRAIDPRWHIPRTSDLVVDILGTAAFYSLVAWAVLAVFGAVLRKRAAR